MIYVRVELWPRGDRSAAKVLGEAQISNSGGTHSLGNYTGWVQDKTAQSRKRGFVVSYPRLSRSVWVLIARFLKSVGHQ
jgi:hypothetical protein